MALERSTKADFQATRDANDPAQAMDHFKQWKSGVGQLHEAIDRQLKFCQDLRSNRTLLSLYEDTESEGLRKHVNNLVTQMKVDIRSILKRYPSATAIALPDLDVEELEEELLREAYEHKMSEGKRGGEKGDKKSTATGGEGKTSSNSNKARTNNWILKKRGTAVESALARVCREGGARVRTHQFIRDLNISGISPNDTSNKAK